MASLVAPAAATTSEIVWVLSVSDEVLQPEVDHIVTVTVIPVVVPTGVALVVIVRVLWVEPELFERTQSELKVAPVGRPLTAVMLV